ncbi:uncharacterized protein LOC103035564 [Astyanax mexicanus]|uniref:uncharacterized protein LOC103035564 n=1 Tax=Astyanax mexicanus TaxID=7994 RepID=UPI0020CB5E61|nr:uncharacterized protein LOC103035564 [Astyanax mexicanus]
MAEKVRRKYSIEDKRRLLEMYDRLPNMSQKKAAMRLNITQSVLWTILRNRNIIMRGEPHHVRCGKVPRLEAALWRWIDAMRRRGAAPSDLLIHRRAMELAARMGLTQFRASPNWYRGFKRREKTVRELYHVQLEEQNQTERPQPGSAANLLQNLQQNPLYNPLQLNQQQKEEMQVVVKYEGQVERSELLSVKLEPADPTVVTAEINGGMKTITVPSLHQMKEAMQTLATGLLYRGFCDFKLLHQFEKEVANVVKRSLAQGSRDSFQA